jgi:hypothetical protein
MTGPWHLRWRCMVNGDRVQRKLYRLKLSICLPELGPFLSNVALRRSSRSLENKDAIYSARVRGLDGRATTKAIVW